LGSLPAICGAADRQHCYPDHWIRANYICRPGQHHCGELFRYLGEREQFGQRYRYRADRPCDHLPGELYCHCWRPDPMRLAKRMKAIRPLRLPPANQGFTLVEVLVTVVIFSVGLLGLAGLQATGIKLNHSSLIRSQATLLAYEIVDSMRANRTNVAGYAIAIDADPPGTVVTLADQDLVDWIGNLSQTLPSGDGSVSLNGNRATVVVQWDDMRNPNIPVKSMTLVSEI